MINYQTMPRRFRNLLKESAFCASIPTLVRMIGRAGITPMILTAAATVCAESAISPIVVSGGGGSATDGTAVLSATFGEFGAGDAMQNDDFSMQIGFWVMLPCPTDLNGDRDIDTADLGILIGQFGQPGDGINSDINQDGVVDTADLGILIAAFGDGCG